MQEVKAVHDKVRSGHNIQLPNKLADSDNTGLVDDAPMQNGILPVFLNRSRASNFRSTMFWRGVVSAPWNQRSIVQVLASSAALILLLHVRVYVSMWASCSLQVVAAFTSGQAVNATAPLVKAAAGAEQLVNATAAAIPGTHRSHYCS